MITDLFKERLNVEKTTDQPNSKSQFPPTIEHPIFEHGIIDGFSKIGYGIDEIIRRTIHIAICSSFYLLIGCSIGFGTYKIFEEFIGLSKGNMPPMPAGQTHIIGGIDIFRPAENIFLYLLPIFILFVFYNYYITNTSVYLLGGNPSKIDEDRSTHSMNLTKTIFISSIVSYVLIKSVEEVFYHNCDNYPKLIAAGVLLSMLMGYFILLHRKEHASPSSSGGRSPQRPAAEEVGI